MTSIAILQIVDLFTVGSFAFFCEIFAQNRCGFLIFWSNNFMLIYQFNKTFTRLQKKR